MVIGSLRAGLSGLKWNNWPRLCFYQTRSAWSMDQGSNKNHSPAYHFAPTVTKFCVMWEGSSLPHDTKFGNCRCETVDSRAFPSWSLIHGLRWSSLIKAEPGVEPLATSHVMYVPFSTSTTKVWPLINAELCMHTTVSVFVGLVNKANFLCILLSQNTKFTFIIQMIVYIIW